MWGNSPGNLADLLPILLILVTLTRHTQVDQSKGSWCFDTSPILGYTIGSNKQMYLGGDRGIPHGFSCTSLLPQILVDFRIEIELNVGPYLTPSSLIKRLELPCTGQFTLLSLKSSSRSGTHFQGSEKSANFVFSHFHRVPSWRFWHLCDPIEKFQERMSYRSFSLGSLTSLAHQRRSNDVPNCNIRILVGPRVSIRRVSVRF